MLLRNRSLANSSATRNFLRRYKIYRYDETEADLPECYMYTFIGYEIAWRLTFCRYHIDTENKIYTSICICAKAIAYICQ